MPDTRLTLAGLREHFRTHAAMYAVGVVAALLLSNLLWVVTAPRIASDQSVVIFLAGERSDAGALAAIADDALARARAFDPALRRVEFRDLLFDDANGRYTGTILLMSRLSLGEADAFLLSADAMDALLNAGGALPLDAYLEAGWLSDCPLEPLRAPIGDGEAEARVVGLRLDDVDALAGLGAFDNEGAFLAIAANSDNPDTAMRVVACVLDGLVRGGAHPEEAES